MAHPNHDNHADQHPTDPSNTPVHASHGERHVPLRSPTGGTDWSENMRRSRPTNKGKGVPGQRRG